MTGFMLGSAHNHTSVVAQPPYNSPYYSHQPICIRVLPCFGIYAGFAKTRHKKIVPGSRITAGSNWLDTLHYAMENL